MAAGFQADKHRSFVAELAQTRFKSSKTFYTGEHFYRLEEHVAASIDCRSAMEAFSNVDTNEDVDQIIDGGGDFHSFLSLWG